MNRFGQQRSFLFTLVPILIGVIFVIVIGGIVLQVIGGVWLVQHPTDAGIWVRDVVAPVIQEIKK